MTRTLLATTLGLLLAGCSLAPDYQRPVTPTGASWQASQDQQTTRGWKATFSDPALQELISQALANNRDLRIAA
ncbi:MAG: multidrug transporter, partial [Aeromonadaceae bacterium]